MILEKYFGWLICVGLLVFFSTVAIPQELQILVDWFAPITGVTLGPTLAIAFMILASGLKYHLILLAWAISGFACGAVARGGIRRAITVPLGAFSAFAAILGANIYPMIRIFGSIGAAGLPPLPPGVALSDILSLPLISDLLPIIQSAAFTNVQGSLGASYLTIAMAMISGLVVNLVTLCAFSVGGCLASTKLIPRIMKKGDAAVKADIARKGLVLGLLALMFSAQLPLVSGSPDTVIVIDSPFALNVPYPPTALFSYYTDSFSINIHGFVKRDTEGYSVTSVKRLAITNTNTGVVREVPVAPAKQSDFLAGMGWEFSTEISLVKGRNIIEITLNYQLDMRREITEASLTSLFAVDCQGRGRLVEKISGTLEMLDKVTGKWLPIDAEIVIQEGDIVRTVGENVARLAFQYGAAMVLGPNVIVALKVLKTTVGIFTLLKGAIRLVVVGGECEVHTVTAVAAVRGTDFTVEAAVDNSTTIQVLEGKVEVRDPSSNSTVILDANKEIHVPQTPRGLTEQQMNERISTLDPKSVDRWWEEQQEQIPQGSEGPFAVGSGESVSLQFQSDGGLSVTYSYGGIDLSAKGITLSPPDLQGVLFAGFAVKRGVVTALQEEMSQMLAILPEKGFFFVSKDLGSEEAKTRAQRLSSQFEAALKIKFGEPSVLQVPMPGQQMSIITCNAPQGLTYEAAFNAYRSLLPPESLSKLLVAEKVLQKPFLAIVGAGTPGEGQSGSAASSFATAFVDWSRDLLSGTGRFTFSLKETMGFTDRISSSLAGGSTVLVQLPQTVNMSTLSVYPTDAVISARTVSLKVDAAKTYDDLRITFEARFPPRMTVTKVASPPATSAGGTVTITVEVKNLGNAVVSNVRLDDVDSIRSYQPSASVISGSTTGTWSIINPNETKTITYNVRLGANGKYTLEPARATYSDQHGTYSKTSERLVVTSNFDIGTYLQKLVTDPITVVNPFTIGLIVAIILPPVKALLTKPKPRREAAETKAPAEEAVKPQPQIEEEREEPLKIIKLRYARGEITKEEYEELRKTLEDS